MLQYSKKVLSQVIFDQRLFAKELQKSLRWLGHGDQEALLAWCKQEFPNMSRTKF